MSATSAARTQPLALSPCPGCAYDYDATTTDAARRLVVESAEEARVLLLDAPPRLRWRPEPEVWSPLEYGCHLRDVLLAERERLVLALVSDGPHFDPLYRDERVALLRYADENPQRLADALVLAAQLFDWVAQSLDAGQLKRRCTYDLPAATQVDMAWVIVHTAHEMHHHLGDIRRGLAATD
jgi:DinB superfamily